MQQQLGRMGPLKASLPGSRHFTWGVLSILDLLVPGPLPHSPCQRARNQERRSGELGASAPLRCTSPVCRSVEQTFAVCMPEAD